MAKKKRTFEFYADVVDGKILSTPQEFTLYCERTRPLGLDVVRQFNGNECILAKRAFFVWCDNHLFGNSSFTTFAQYNQFQNAACRIAPCGFTIGGCVATTDGYSLIINGN